MIKIIGSEFIGLTDKVNIGYKDTNLNKFVTATVNSDELHKLQLNYDMCDYSIILNDFLFAIEVGNYYYNQLEIYTQLNKNDCKYINFISMKKMGKINIELEKDYMSIEAALKDMGYTKSQNKEILSYKYFSNKILKGEYKITSKNGIEYVIFSEGYQGKLVKNITLKQLHEHFETCKINGLNEMVGRFLYMEGYLSEIDDRLNLEGIRSIFYEKHPKKFVNSSYIYSFNGVAFKVFFENLNYNKDFRKIKVRITNIEIA